MPKTVTPTPEAVVSTYLKECARIAKTGAATKERSYYTAIDNLLGRLGAPTLTTLVSPAAREKDFPDLALYEADTNVLVLPVEVKHASFAEKELLTLSQAISYSKTFGGGHVLLTNLWQFVWAELDSGGKLREREVVNLIADPTLLATAATPKPSAGATSRLLSLIHSATGARATIFEAGRLATLLAHHARLMLDAILATKDPAKLLKTLSDSMRDGLGMDLDQDFFVPTVVQTLIYGLFATWLECPDPASFDRRDVPDLLRPPVIGEMFHQITQPAFVKQCNLVPRLDAIARTLRRVDRRKFVEQFDDRAIEYFYEPFLARFDPDLRDKLGVWYTPREVAQYQVQRIDRHLRDDFGIVAGIADPQVIVLDPAVGTGTYLRAVLEAIHRFHVANGEPPELAAQLVKKDALSRVIGFEVLPAAFVIGHLQLGHLLAGLHAPLVDDERVRIYLTNSLVGWGTGAPPPPTPLPGLEQELRASLEVKASEPVLVILGNPPYHGFSAADTKEERTLLSDWIDPLWSKWGLRKSRLGDLYVRFWRVAVRKIAEMTRRGIVCFITNRKWLGGRSYPEMREYVVKHFQSIVVDDLHGNVHDTSHPGDGSVFSTATAPGIRTGVAITTLVRTGEPSDGEVATVRTRDFRGSGLEKRERLALLATTADIDKGLEKNPVSRGTRWKLVADKAGDFPNLSEYFRFQLSGVQPVREVAVLDFEEKALKARMRDYFDKTIPDVELFSKFPGFGVVRERYKPAETRRKLLSQSGFTEARTVPFLYKPFDSRYLYWEPHHKLLNEARRQLIPCYLGGDEEHPRWISEQFTIVCSQTPRRPGAARPALSSAVPGFHAVDPDARAIPRLAPLELGRAETPLFGKGSTVLTTNTQPEWIEAARRVGMQGSDEELGDVVFYALIAVMYSPKWAESIGTDADDFASVPLPSKEKQLRAAAELGKQIAALADTRTPVAGVTTGKLRPGTAAIGRPDAATKLSLTAGTPTHGGRYDEPNQTIHWDEKHGWHQVPTSVWEFRVGGFQVLPKWLGYRHADTGHLMSAQDVENVAHICRRISALVAFQPTCDALYESAAADPFE